MKVGFVGLGRMGQAMALNLQKSGVDLVVCDTRREAAHPLLANGALWAESPDAVARQTAVIFTSLPGPTEIEAVTLGPAGIMEGIHDDSILFDLSTSSLSLTRRIGTAFEQRHAVMLDAPVSGGPSGAASGNLALWVGGDKATYERHVALLGVIGNAPMYVGPVGAGTITKLAHNMLAHMVMLSMAEVFSMGVKGGLDPLDLWSALRAGSIGKGPCLDLLVNQFLPGSFAPAAFEMKLAHEDLALASALGRELGVPMRLANMTLEELTEAVGKGLGNQDTRAFLTLQLQRAGVNIRVDPERLRDTLRAQK